jgi:aspartyl protease family protein
MNLGNIVSTIAVAGVIAVAINFFIVPRMTPVSPDDVNSQLRAQAATETRSFEAQSPQPGETRRSARIPIRDDGHYWARALVNQKTSVEFMVDTGASIVALTYKDAQRMGLNPQSLDYKWTISTAGGDTMGASVLIDSIKINQVHIRNVEAMVLKSDLSQSLLGMSYLRQLYSYEFRGDRMIIKQ